MPSKKIDQRVAMFAPSKALHRIETYFKDFQFAVANCQSGKNFVAADWQDAYARLARLRERFLAEKLKLSESQRKALSKVFEDDCSTKGILEIRQVGEHMRRPRDFTIRTTRNEPITPSSESSAMAVFSGVIVTLTDVGGDPHRIDHLEMLQEMENV